VTISCEVAERLFTRGELKELVRLVDQREPPAQALEPNTRIIVAHAFAIMGEWDRACVLAEVECRSPTSLAIHSRAESIMGLVRKGEGNFAAAVNHFRASLRYARESRDAERIAWSQLHLFRFLMENHPIDVVTAMVPELRRVVAKAGLPQVTAYLHLSISVFDGYHGRIDEALRHCDIADSLLQLAPNVWMLANANLNRASIACLECKFKDAARYIQSATDLIARSGHARGAWASANNLGYIETMTGHYDSALASFSRAMTIAKGALFPLVEASDGLARLYLAVGKLNQCEEVLRYIIDDAGRKDEALAVAYPVRWAAITKARLLIKRGAYRDALEWIELVERQSLGIRDVSLLATRHLVAAQAHAKLGNLASASNRLVLAHNVGASTIPELRPQYYYAASQVVRQINGTVADLLSDRAIRIWDAQGVVAVQSEMEEAPTSGSAHVRTTDPMMHSDVECVANSLAALIDLAATPRVFADEMLRLMRALKCSPDARIIESRAGAAEPQSLDSTVVVPLGIRDRRQFTLVCPFPSDPAKAILLGDVLRIGRAALALEQARREERSRAALWPAMPVEEEAGALFLAEEMRTLLATARRIAPTNVPVLITGETGTGKEVLARTIHAYSTRASATFLPFNCTGAPKDLLDSQLFGHRRGAFTGALEHFPGVIRAAAGGTLFLDEIGETTPDVQPKLLRFLESGEVHPIGETQPQKADVRVIAATNADLEALVAQGRFREDLFYRLNIVRLHVPPLRERRVEIPAFANHYLEKHAHECQKGDLRLAEETMEYLLLYRWPGNVRQLANEMRRMAALAEAGAVLMPEHLSADIAASRRTVPPSERPLDPNELAVRVDQPMAAAVQHVERALIQYALTKCEGRMEETAAMLGLSRKGLYLKRVRYGLEPPESAASDVA
jgi:DNA-binding NtrC family response regulator